MSGGNAERCTFTPNPTITCVNWPPSDRASARMPPSFRAPRTVPDGAITRSFGHLMATGSPEAACSPSEIATPVASVSHRGQSCGAAPCRASTMTEV
jgi:hypothetical protein